MLPHDTQSASHTLLHISWYNQDMQSLRLSLFIVFANELLSVGQLHACTCFPLAPLLAAVLKTATFLLLGILTNSPALCASQTVQQRSVPSLKGPNRALTRVCAVMGLSCYVKGVFQCELGVSNPALPLVPIFLHHSTEPHVHVLCAKRTAACS